MNLPSTTVYQLPENWFEKIRQVVEQNEKLLHYFENRGQAEKKILEFTDAQNFTLKEVAKIVGCSIETLYKDIEKGVLRASSAKSCLRKCGMVGG